MTGIKLIPDLGLFWPNAFLFFAYISVHISQKRVKIIKIKLLQWFKNSIYCRIKKIEERIAQQNRLKYYDRVKQGKYKMMCGGQEAQLEQELTRQLDRLRALGAIVSKLGDEYPDMQMNMRRVETSIQSRLNQEEEAAAASAHVEKI